MLRPIDLPPAREGAFVSSLHDSRSSSRDDTEAILRKELANSLRLLVDLVLGFDPGGSEDAHCRMTFGEGLESFHKFCHDMKHPPGFLRVDLIDNDTVYSACFLLFPTYQQADVSRELLLFY